MKTYNIFVKYNDGRTTMLTAHGRTRWQHRTAKKHLREVIAQKTNGGKWLDVSFFAILEF